MNQPFDRHKHQIWKTHRTYFYLEINADFIVYALFIHK